MMPNHVHGLFWLFAGERLAILGSCGRNRVRAKSHRLSRQALRLTYLGRSQANLPEAGGRVLGWCPMTPSLLAPWADGVAAPAHLT